MQCGERQLGLGLDGHGVDVLIAEGLEDPLGVGAVGLVARDVRRTTVAGPVRANRGSSWPRDSRWLSARLLLP